MRGTFGQPLRGEPLGKYPALKIRHGRPVGEVGFVFVVCFNFFHIEKSEWEEVHAHDRAGKQGRSGLFSLHMQGQGFTPHRRGLEQRFPRKSLGETRRQFAHRMANVQAYMNSPEFAAQDGGGLLALAESFRERCRQVVLLKGERLRT